MANGKDLELALRIKADLKQGQAALKSFAESVMDVGDASQQANRQLGNTGTAVDQTSARVRAAAGAARTHEAAQLQAARATGVFTADVRNLGQASAQAANQQKQLETTSKTIGGGFTALATSAKAATATIAAGFGLAQIAQASDAWTSYQNRLRLVTASQQDLAGASQDVYRIAQNTSQSLDSTAAVYQRFTQNAERLNITQKEAASLTDTVSKAIAISGGSAMSAEAALVQFGQALASGVLRGEEFNSVSEQAPALLMAIADGLGVNIGQLRAMANEGQLTADVLVDALGNAAASIDEQFSTRVKTIAQAGIEMDNAFTRLVGTFSSGQGAGVALAESLSGLASVLDSLAENADVLGVALDIALSLAAGKAIVALTGLAAETLKTIIVQKAQTAATLQLAQAEATETAANLAATRQRYAAFASHTAVTAATQANTAAQAKLGAAQLAASAASNVLGRAFTGVIGVAGRLVGFLGGPVGIAISLALAATAFIDFGDDAENGMDKAATATESASVRVRNATRNMIQGLKIGDSSTASYDQLSQGIDALKTQLSEAEAIQNRVQALTDNDIPDVPGLDLPTLDAANEKVRSLSAALQQLERERGGDRFKGVREGQEYLDSLQKQNERLQNLSTTEQAVAYLRKNQIADTSALGQSILQQASANERLDASNQASTETQRAAEAADKARLQTSEQLQRSQQGYVAQLERQATTAGMNAEQVRAYELAEKGLTGALLSRAQAAQVTLAAAERQKQVDQDLVQLADLRASLLRGEGDAAGASAIEIEKKYGALQKRLQAAGNTEGAGLIDKLINIEQAKAQLDQLSQALDGVFSEQSRREQTINTQQQAGLISELGARQQILDLNKSTADQVEKLLPKMRALADVTGDPAAIERVKDLEARLGSLRIVANEVTNALKAGFETGLQGALQGLASGTMGLREAATAFIQDIASSMAGLASQNLAKMASDSLSGLFASGAGVATEGVASAADATASASAITAASTAGATAMGTGITTSGTAAATAMGTSITTAGTAAASAMATAIATAGAASSTTDALATGAKVVAAATGGQVLGPGTGTSDSIPAWLSHTEFVTRAAVVTQPGALGFLRDFNARGMSALDDWARAVHHSTGGLAGVPAPALPRPAMGNGRLAEPAKAVGATVKNAQNFILVDDPSRITEAAYNTPQGVEGMVVMLSKDPAKFRSILGING